ncbi:parathyroid hormone/parathyroid hormone-related peptide receptor-like [Haliotis rufescens]|uniref:parathyroid hormone/parathyroid hormone-related peptide receptor-like n=1 Tax=Haliotis rufescens TaxID=6454 RepID=UPI00201F8BEA|nr:parathyroid hormone/parathyroid hormone-related peptide receptor-like [Haliotis rufescens]
MSKMEQRRLLLEAKVACYWKMVDQENRSTQGYEFEQPVKVCGVVWDDVLCWDAAPAGSIATQPCPDYINGFNRNENATRRCTDNGTWFVSPERNHTWTNFTACPKSTIDLKFHVENAARLRLMYSAGYSISVAFLVVAVIIMLCCRRMHSKSNTLHINLFIAFILRASVSFLKDLLFKGVGLDMDVRLKSDGTYEFLDGPHWQCKLLFVIFNYSISVSIMWIFIEGLYLHMLIYKTLATERRGVKMYIILGWVMPVFLLIPWVIVKAVYEDTFCWNIQENRQYFWILKGPGVAIVIINFVSFVDISRILCMRARHSKTSDGKAKYRKLAKFILVLIPLFGVTYIVFLVAFPAEFNTQFFNIAHLYIEMAYNSFQGLVLAVLFCFLNEEVHGELNRLWRRHQSRRNDMAAFRMSSNSSWKKASKPSPALERRHRRERMRKQASSTTEYKHEHTDALLKTALLTRAFNVISRSDDVTGEGGEESVTLPVKGVVVAMDNNANTHPAEEILLCDHEPGTHKI